MCSMASQSQQAASSESSHDLCAFCQREDADPYVVGRTFSKGSVVVHEFCLVSKKSVDVTVRKMTACLLCSQYFSSGLCQQTSTDKGIQGFLLSDIKKELLRGRKQHKKTNKKAALV